MILAAPTLIGVTMASYGRGQGQGRGRGRGRDWGPTAEAWSILQKPHAPTSPVTHALCYTFSMASSDRESAFLGPPGTPYRGGKLLGNLLLFGRVCRGLGMQVTPLRMVEVSRALQHVRLAARQDFYHTLRALMVSKAPDLPLFEEAFQLFWRQPARGWTQLDLRSLGETRRRRTRFVPSLDDSREGEPGGTEAAAPLLLPTYSPRELLRQKDFAAMTAQEMALARKWIAKMTPRLGFRRTRRLAPAESGRPLLNRLLRRTLRNQGEVVEFPCGTPKQVPRPLVLICDVSGSMERYTQLLLHFTHALSAHLGQVESFVFSTRLTRITRSVRIRSVEGALKRVAGQVKDWSGGTLTGQALRRFNYRWGRRVLGRGAVVLLVTDGWDRGDPDSLSRELARLRRSCFRVIWLNPLQGGARYQPLTRGAQAILPFCDDHLSVRNLASLEVLARHLAALPAASGKGQVGHA